MMKLNVLFSVNEKIWIKKGTDVDSTTFKEAVIKKIDSNQMGVEIKLSNELFKLCLEKTLLLNEIKENVYKQTWLINHYVNEFLNYDEKTVTQNQLSKQEYLDFIHDQMLTLQFCDACMENEGFKEELEIEGLKYIGKVQHFFGEVENYYLEGVYQLNEKYYVSHSSEGNGHCHISLMEADMVKELEEKLLSAPK